MSVVSTLLENILERGQIVVAIELRETIAESVRPPDAFFRVLSLFLVLIWLILIFDKLFRPAA